MAVSFSWYLFSSISDGKKFGLFKVQGSFFFFFLNLIFGLK